MYLSKSTKCKKKLMIILSIKLEMEENAWYLEKLVHFY